MAVVAPLCGLLLLLAVARDVFRTVLLPASSSRLTDLVAGGLWGLAARAPRMRSRGRAVVGPLTVVVGVVLWLGLLLLGFALCYLPWVDELAYTPSADFGRVGLAEAVYLSGTSLTTVGFGDVVAQTTALRLLTVAEAACGLAVLTATLGYLPAIYTVMSSLRTANQAVADLGADAPEGAAELLAVEPAVRLDDVRRDVLAVRQHLQRFPVLHWFHPPDDESVVALGRGALGLWVAAHFAADGGRPLHRHVKALEQALRRLADELAAHGGGEPPSADPRSAVRQFEVARARAADPRAAAAAHVPEDSVTVLSRLRQVLDGYAAHHGYAGQ